MKSLNVSGRRVVNIVFPAAVLLSAASFGYWQYAHAAQAGAAAPNTPANGQSVAQPPQAFTDVPKSHWSASAVNELAAKNIILGEPTASNQAVYDGNRFVTRYEAAVLLDRFAKCIEQGRQPLHAELQPDSNMPAVQQSWARTAQLDLVKSNYLPKTSPLFQGSGNAPVSGTDFSAALAQVVVRVSDRGMPLTPNAADFDDEDLGK